MSAGRTIGAAIGLALFVIFFATIAGRLTNPVSAAEPNSAACAMPRSRSAGSNSRHLARISSRLMPGI